MVKSNHTNVRVNGVSVGLFHNTVDNNEMNDAMYKARSNADAHNTGDGSMVGHRRVPHGEGFRLQDRARVIIRTGNQKSAAMVVQQ